MDIDLFEHKLQIATADDVNTNGSFGEAVDVDGNYAIVTKKGHIGVNSMTMNNMSFFPANKEGTSWDVSAFIGTKRGSLSNKSNTVESYLKDKMNISSFNEECKETIGVVQNRTKINNKTEAQKEQEEQKEQEAQKEGKTSKANLNKPNNSLMITSLLINNVLWAFCFNS